MKLSRSQNSIAFIDTRDTEYHGKIKVNQVLKKMATGRVRWPTLGMLKAGVLRIISR